MKWLLEEAPPTLVVEGVGLPVEGRGDDWRGRDGVSHGGLEVVDRLSDGDAADGAEEGGFEDFVGAAGEGGLWCSAAQVKREGGAGLEGASLGGGGGHRRTSSSSRDKGRSSGVESGSSQNGGCRCSGFIVPPVSGQSEIFDLLLMVEIGKGGSWSPRKRELLLS